MSNSTLNQRLEKLWDSIEALWKDPGVKKCARRGNEYHLIDSGPYFLDRVHVIRLPKYLPDEQDILRCRVLTNAISETRFQMKKVNFHIFDVGGQRDQRRKWIQCFNKVTAITFVVDISSFNMTLRENHRVNRLKESLNSFRLIWINRYLYHISIILFLNKYDIFVKKIVEEQCKLEDYFPDYKNYQLPTRIEKHLVVADENPEVTRAKMFILEQFINITNERLEDSLAIVMAIEEAEAAETAKYGVLGEGGGGGGDYYHVLKIGAIPSTVDSSMNKISKYYRAGDAPVATNSGGGGGGDFYETKFHRQLKKSYRDAREESVNGKFCIPYFTCAIDTDNIKRVFKACSHILKKEHLENSGLL